MTTPRIRVLIGDDHATLRAGLRMLIDAQHDMTVVGEAGDGEMVLQQAALVRPDGIVGWIYADLKRNDLAAETLTAAIALYDRTGRGAERGNAFALTLLGEVRIAQDRCADAIPILERASALMRTVAATLPDWVAPLADLAKCRRVSGHAADMLVRLEEAEAVARKGPLMDEVRAAVYWEYAQTLTAVKRSPARADALVAEARTLYAANPKRFVEELAAIDRYLAARHAANR